MSLHVVPTRAGGTAAGEGWADWLESLGWTIAEYTVEVNAVAAGLPGATSSQGQFVKSWHAVKAGQRELYWIAVQNGSDNYGYIYHLGDQAWLYHGPQCHNLVDYSTTHDLTDGVYTITPRNSTSWDWSLIGHLTWDMVVEPDYSVVAPESIVVEPGTYEYHAQLEGYRDQVGTIVVADGETTALEITMVAEAGTVSVVSTPPGAVITFESEPE